MPLTCISPVDCVNTLVAQYRAGDAAEASETLDALLQDATILKHTVNSVAARQALWKQLQEVVAGRHTQDHLVEALEHAAADAADSPVKGVIHLGYLRHEGMETEDNAIGDLEVGGDHALKTFGGRHGDAARLNLRWRGLAMSAIASENAEGSIFTPDGPAELEHALRVLELNLGIAVTDEDHFLNGSLLTAGLLSWEGAEGRFGDDYFENPFSIYDLHGAVGMGDTSGLGARGLLNFVIGSKKRVNIGLDAAVGTHTLMTDLGADFFHLEGGRAMGRLYARYHSDGGLEPRNNWWSLGVAVLAQKAFGGVQGDNISLQFQLAVKLFHPAWELGLVSFGGSGTDADGHDTVGQGTGASLSWIYNEDDLRITFGAYLLRDAVVWTEEVKTKTGLETNTKTATHGDVGAKSLFVLRGEWLAAGAWKFATSAIYGFTPHRTDGGDSTYAGYKFSGDTEFQLVMEAAF